MTWVAIHRYEQIAEELRREIREGRWPPGTRLPSTEHLIARYAVSRMTLRQAIERLRLDGLVQTRQGAGVFVLAPGAELPHPRRAEEPVERLFTRLDARLDALEERVLGDLADIRDKDLAEINRRLDVIEGRLGDGPEAPQTDEGREAPCGC